MTTTNSADECQIFHGRVFNQHQTRVGVRTGKIDENLFAHLTDEAAFPSLQTLDVLKETESFEKCVDYPQLPEHKYFEGYFHAHTGELLEKDGTVTAIHPRWGMGASRLPAPIRWAAFVEAIRRHNNSWFEMLKGDLPEDEAGNRLRTWIDQGRVFADFSVQVHYGTEVGRESVGWHHDACNSLLHMAISIHGTRALCTVDLPTSTPAQTREKAREEDAEFTKERWQTPGDVYMSSPFAFRHGVQYPETEWKDRIIAIQSRILITSDELMTSARLPWKETVEALTRRLESEPIELPALEEVLAVEAELRTRRVFPETLDVEKKSSLFNRIFGK